MADVGVHWAKARFTEKGKRIRKFKSKNPEATKRFKIVLKVWVTISCLLLKR